MVDISMNYIQIQLFKYESRCHKFCSPHKETEANKTAKEMKKQREFLTGQVNFNCDVVNKSNVKYWSIFEWR